MRNGRSIAVREHAYLVVVLQTTRKDLVISQPPRDKNRSTKRLNRYFFELGQGLEPMMREKYKIEVDINRLSLHITKPAQR